MLPVVGSRLLKVLVGVGAQEQESRLRPAAQDCLVQESGWRWQPAYSLSGLPEILGSRIRPQGPLVPQGQVKVQELAGNNCREMRRQARDESSLQGWGGEPYMRRSAQRTVIEFQALQGLQHKINRDAVLLRFWGGLLFVFSDGLGGC